MLSKEENIYPSERLLSVDRIRGAAVIIMVIGNYIAGVDIIPTFLKHAKDIGFTVADIVAPFFLLAIGLTYKMSYERRLLRDGGLKTTMHFVTRYCTLIGIGAIFTAGSVSAANIPSNWGVLQAIGVAGLITLVFIRFNAAARTAAALVILILYQISLNRFWLDAVLSSDHGGFYGALSWTALLLLSTVAAELFFKKKAFCWIFASGLSIAGAVSAFFVPVSKNRVSLSYVLISLAICTLIFLIFDYLNSKVTVSAGFFVWWGENPVILYILHLIILGVFTLPNIPFWYKEAPVWLILLQVCFIVFVLSAIAYKMHIKKVKISF